MFEKYYTMQEAIEKIGISRQWMYVLIAQGKAPKHIKQYKKFLFDKKDVEALAASRKS